MRKEILCLVWSPPLALILSLYFLVEAISLMHEREKLLAYLFFALTTLALIAFVYFQKLLYDLLMLHSPKPPGRRKSIPRPKAGVFDIRRKQTCGG